LKARRNDIREDFDKNPAGIAFIFIGIYVVVTGFSLPGATILTLAGGAIFGLGLGIVLVSISSVLGATIAMVLARVVIGNYV